MPGWKRRELAPLPRVYDNAAPGKLAPAGPVGNDSDKFSRRAPAKLFTLISLDDDDRDRGACVLADALSPCVRGDQNRDIDVRSRAR